MFIDILRIEMDAHTYIYKLTYLYIGLDTQTRMSFSYIHMHIRRYANHATKSHNFCTHCIPVFHNRCSFRNRSQVPLGSLEEASVIKAPPISLPFDTRGAQLA